MRIKRMRGMFIVAATMGMWVASAWAGPGQHTVTVTLNYDFSVDNACSPSASATSCVKQFNIYDITGGGTPVI
jgi:hypothetical protein